MNSWGIFVRQKTHTNNKYSTYLQSILRWPRRRTGSFSVCLDGWTRRVAALRVEITYSKQYWFTRLLFTNFISVKKIKYWLKILVNFYECVCVCCARAQRISCVLVFCFFNCHYTVNFLIRLTFFTINHQQDLHHYYYKSLDLLNYYQDHYYYLL